MPLWQFSHNRPLSDGQPSEWVKDNERIDDLQNGYYVIQDPDKFCFGMDAVLLSGFAKVKKGETALDLGTGTGIIPILLKTKTNGKHFTGLEIQKECADMAGRSVRYNHLEDDVEIVRGDIKEAADIFGAASFDVVTSNPPYMIGQHGLRNPDMPKAIARHEVLCNLEDVVSQASKVLKERGRFYMVQILYYHFLSMFVIPQVKLELFYHKSHWKLYTQTKYLLQCLILIQLIRTGMD